MEPKTIEVSYFRPPITNKVPTRNITLGELAAIIASEALKSETVRLRQTGDKAQARAYKGQHFPYVTLSGTFTYCSDQMMVSHSRLVCIDLDDVPDVDRLKQQLIADGRFHTVMAFRSPSGRGLKWVIVIDLRRAGHREWFHAVRNYLLCTHSELTPKMVDSQCQNPSRACFICHDPEVYVNLDGDVEAASGFDPKAWAEQSTDSRTPAVKASPRPQPSQPLHPLEELAKARAVTRELLRRGANIADAYGDYLKLGFALANGLGSYGRELYHDLCRQSSKYNETDCERKWQHCLNKTDGRTTIATFYSMAKQAGVDVGSIAKAYQPKSIYNF